MTDTKNLLQLNGYTVTDIGHIQCNGREDERTAVLRFDLAEDSKAGRDLVEQLLTVADSPRALCGRTKNGSAVLLFRHGRNSPVPHINGQSGDVFKLATRDGVVRLTIVCASDGQTVDVGAYTFQKGRSAFDNGVWALPTLTSDIGATVIDAAFGLGCMWASQYEDERADEQRRADIRSGKIKIPTEAEIQAAEDDRLVAYHENIPLGIFDELYHEVRAARRRVAERKRIAAESAITSTAA